MSFSESEKIPVYPMSRAAGRPFDPPPEASAAPPVGQVKLWNGQNAWYVTQYDKQRELLADRRVSSDISRDGFPSQGPMPPLPLSFMMMDDPEHARLRRMVVPAFTHRRMEAMRPRVQQVVDDLVDALLAGPRPVDLVEALALPVPSLVICALLGVPYQDHPFFQENSRTLVRPTVDFQESMAAAGRLMGYFDDLLGRKITEPEDDVLSHLGERVKNGELDRQEAVGMGMLLLVAGHETTANMIALGSLALLENPDQLALLQGEPEPRTVARAVEELLRYLNVTHMGRHRVAVEDIRFDGVHIRAGDGVIMPNEVANRDPAVFPNGDRLDLTREDGHHVAFGFGVHQCLGQPLARMELQVVYGTLYRRIPTLARVTPLEDLRFKDDGAVYGVDELLVTW